MQLWRRACLLIAVLVVSRPSSGQDLFRRFLVVTDRTSLSALRFDPASGALNDKFTKDIPVYAEGVAFGPDQNLYVTDAACRCVHKFNGSSGRYIGQIVRSGVTPLGIPEGITFGPDGNMYVADIQFSAVRRYDPVSGNMIDTFVAPGSGGLKNPIGLAFGPDRNLYVTSGTPTNANPNEVLSPQVLKYAGDTGEFAGVFVPSRSGGLDSPFDLLFTPDGYL